MGRKYIINADQAQGVNEKFTGAAPKCGPERSDSKKTACQSSKTLPPLNEEEVLRDIVNNIDVPIQFTPFGHGLNLNTKLIVKKYSSGGMKIDWPIDNPDQPDSIIQWTGLNSLRKEDRPSIQYYCELEMCDPFQSRPEKADLDRLRMSNEQSTKSRIRSGWTISNATTRWEFMTTLTYPVSRVPSSYEETSKHRRAFMARAKKTWPDCHIAWFIEFTQKGAAHYHVFWGGEAAVEMAKMPVEKFEKQDFHGRLRDRTVIRGEIDKRIQLWWANQAGDGSEEFKNFQAGGITELMDDPDNAGKYAAKEASKRAQKNGPFLVPSWFGISDSVRPKVDHEFEIDVADYIQAYGPTMQSHLFENRF